MKTVLRIMVILAIGYITAMQALLGDKISSYGPGIAICGFLAWRLIVKQRRATEKKEREDLFTEYMRTQIRNKR